MNRLSLVPLLALAVSIQGVNVDFTSLEALGKLRLHTIVDLLEATGLNDTFADLSADLTLFAPSDLAFAQGLRNLGLSAADLKQQPDALKKILLYHAVPGRHTTADLVNEKIFKTASGDELRTNHYIYNNLFFVDGAKINARDIETKNGVVHVVNGILFPFEGTVYDIIANSSDLTTLKAAIDATGLAPELADQNPITIFCPTDAAFVKLGDLVQKLVNAPGLLKEILLYHVIPGSLYRGGMHSTSLHTFEEKDWIMLGHHGSTDDVDKARLTTRDISASNGVLHKIESVLVPTSLQDEVKNL